MRAPLGLSRSGDCGLRAQLSASASSLNSDRRLPRHARALGCSNSRQPASCGAWPLLSQRTPGAETLPASQWPHGLRPGTPGLESHWGRSRASSGSLAWSHKFPGFQFPPRNDSIFSRYSGAPFPRSLDTLQPQPAAPRPAPRARAPAPVESRVDPLFVREAQHPADHVAVVSAPTFVTHLRPAVREPDFHQPLGHGQGAPAPSNSGSQSHLLHLQVMLYLGGGGGVGPQAKGGNLIAPFRCPATLQLHRACLL